jgi:hypothetical protein
VVKKIGDVFDARAGEAVAGARALARGLQAQMELAGSASLCIQPNGRIV